ncbi:MAG TPA: hypothetical protein VH087_06650 [Thermoanaerobaculia bacterium]|jgi:hypothetical protein|nr:hypothetical protein [Thermoanaerobaculia bacterium]
MVRGLRQALAGVVFLILAAGSFQPFYWRIFRIDRAPMRAYRTELPYRQLPGFHAFLLSVREQTKEGERIALLVPRPLVPSYEFIFERAAYLLYGRTLLPISAASEGDVLAGYRVDASAPHFTKMWRSHGGVFLRRQQ